MTYKYRILPLTGLAAAIALGSSIGAAQTTSKETGSKELQRYNQASSRNADTTNRATSHPILATDVLGMNIDTVGNEKIGEIDEIFIDSTTGEVLAVVVSTGGFLGMGQQQTLISPQDLRFNSDRTLLQTDVNKDQLRSAPRYADGDTTALNQVRPLSKRAADGKMPMARNTSYSERDDRMAANQRNDRNDRTAANDRDDRMAANDRNQSMNRNDNRERAERTGSLQGVSTQARGLAVSDLVGMDVENRQGETIGDVDQVFIDLENRKVAGVVVSTGGFLGMGDRKTLFGIEEMSIDGRNDKILLDYSRDEIGAFAGYTADDPSVFEKLGDRISQMASSTGSFLSGDGGDAEMRNPAYSTSRRPSDHTVFDQGNSSEEIAMTSSIRTAIREDSALSSRANNVTIITREGKVVLRGEVDSKSEKTTVESIAHKKAGRQNVTSELVVAAR